MALESQDPKWRCECGCVGSGRLLCGAEQDVAGAGRCWHPMSRRGRWLVTFGCLRDGWCFGEQQQKGVYFQ